MCEFMRVCICTYAVEGGVCAHLGVRCMRLHICVHTSCVHVQLMGCIMLVPELCSWKEQAGTLGVPQCRGTVLSGLQSWKSWGVESG